MSSIQTQENEFTRDIITRLSQLRLRWFFVNLGIHLLYVLASLVCVWLLVAVVDYTFELTSEVRRVFAWTTSLMAVAGSLGLATWVASSASLKGVIRRLETQFADFGQRLRTIMDIHEGRFETPLPMQRVLGNQTLARWETSAPNQMIPYAALSRWLAFFVLLTGFAGFSMFLNNEWSTALFRSLGVDIPYTKMNVEPGNMEVLEGEAVSLRLSLEGRQGRKVTGKWRSASKPDGSWVESELEPWKPSPSEAGDATDSSSLCTFKIELGVPRESIEYQFETSIGNSEVYRVTVRPLVRILNATTTVQPPAYTKTQSRTFSDLDVTVLAGSDVKMQLAASHALADLKIVVDDRNSPPITLDAKKTNVPNIWELSLPSERSLHWHTVGSGDDGTPLETAKGRLRVREDTAPRISWKKGDEAIEVHTLAEVPLQIAASDDYGIQSAQIVVQFSNGEEKVLADLDETQINESAKIDLATILELETLGLTQRDYLGFYAVAQDNCEPNPRTASTDVRFIDIRPLRQKFREQEFPQLEEGAESLFKPLNDLIRTERLLINQTRRLVSLSPEVISTLIKQLDKMVEVQSELAGNTAFLAGVFIAQGNDDVESLRQAEASMLQAADSLSAGKFDTALLQEQDALRWLVETRDALEVILDKNPKMGKKVKQAMDSLQTKLRRKRPPTAMEIADQLDQVANTEAAIAAKSSNLASSSTNGTGVPKQADNDEKMDSDETMDPAQKLLDEQRELTKTVDDIATQVAKQTWPSKTIPERMDELVKSIGAAEQSLASTDRESFASLSQKVTDDAHELASHIRALNPDDPLESLTALAALTQQQSKMESELAGNGKSSRSKGKKGAGGKGEGKSSEKGQSGSNGDAKSDQESDANGKTNSEQLANRIAARAQTIEDILSSLKAPGNSEASEVVSQVEQWVESAGFSKTLAESKAQAGSSNDPDSKEDEKSPAGESGTEKAQDEDAGKEGGESEKDAEDRSAKYSMASEFMTELYQQLASPKLDRLRKLEQKSRALQEAQQANNNASGAKGGDSSEEGQAEDEEPKLSEADAEIELRELQEELRRAGLAELASMLTGDSAAVGEISGTTTTNYRGMGSIERGLRGVVQGLRYEIQTIISEQISADRNIPVPKDYEDAVDRYFEAIASPRDESESLR